MKEIKPTRGQVLTRFSNKIRCQNFLPYSYLYTAYIHVSHNDVGGGEERNKKKQERGRGGMHRGDILNDPGGYARQSLAEKKHCDIIVLHSIIYFICSSCVCTYVYIVLYIYSL